MFTKPELEILAKLLGLAAEEFGNHGCNDFELPASEENVGLIKQIKPEFEPNIENGTIMTNDTTLMYYFQTRCRQELERIAE